MAMAQTVNLEQVLPLVQRPGRYIGGEHNQIKKDLNKVEVKIALCFPDLYEIGMSHLGLKILYGLLNQHDYIAAERAFTVGVDLEAIMREEHIPLFSLESRWPLAEFDIIGFSLQYEMNYTNVLNMLSLSGIPLKSSERDESFPLIIAGGPCSVNPEPMAEFIDAFLIGEGEEAALEIVEAIREGKSLPCRLPAGRQGRQGKSNKNELLLNLAQIPGVYVPSLYEVSYNTDGTINSFRPTHNKVPPTIKKRIVSDLEKAYFPTKSVVPFIPVVHDRIILEIMRGCPHQCRFCQASNIYSPCRKRSKETILKLARDSYINTGYEEISLVSLSSADYPEIISLLSDLNSDFKEKGISLSLPSLRISNLLEQLPILAAAVKKSGLTFALETGSRRLRKLIYKDISLDKFFECLKIIYKFGYKRIKLYFMLGLPTEEDADLEETAELIKKSAEGASEVAASISSFIPKPHTSWERECMADVTLLEGRQNLLKSRIPRGKKIKLKFHNVELSYLEAVLSRGDRRLSSVIEAAFNIGAKFDSWFEHFHFNLWQEAFKKCAVNPEFYLRPRRKDEILPWQFIELNPVTDR